MSEAYLVTGTRPPAGRYAGTLVAVRTDDHRGDDLARELSDLVKHNVGVTVRLGVLAPGALERSIGKAKRLVDNRSKG